MSNRCSRISSIDLLCAMVMLTSAGSAWSALNKCTAKDGKVVYTEQPCEPNQTRSTVKVASTPPGSQASGPRKNRILSPGQKARCESARRAVDSLRREIADGRHKDKVDLVASARQEIASTEQLVREQCD